MTTGGGLSGGLGRAAEERALLDLLFEEEGLGPGGEGVLPRPRRDDPPPLSYAQELLWLLDRLTPGGTSYNVRWATRISGPLDVPALRRALGAVVDRHEVLRTTYDAPGGSPVQVVAPGPPPALPLVDLSHLPAEAREAEVGRMLREAARRPFDLSRDVLGGTLIALGGHEHVLLLTLHHIMCDGWSRGVFFRELAALYEAFRDGRPSPLPPLPVQYADYAVWQRQALAGERLEGLLAYWRGRLAGAPDLLDLPTDRPRPPVLGSRGGRRVRQLPETLADSLRSLGRREGTTLFMTLLSAFQALLYRYTGREDVVVGSPIAGRNRAETEGLIGLFANALALRAEMTGGMTFRALLARTRETCLSAYEHQDLPFEKLVVELRPERSLSHTPVFQVMFILQNTPREERRLAGLGVSAVDTTSDTTKFDLTLSVTEGEGGLRAVLAYNADLFDGATAERMLGHYQALLEGVVEDPDRPLIRLPMLGEAETRRLLVDGSGPRAERPRGLCAHHLVEAQAARSPSAPAVSGGGRVLSYGELDARSNRLARHLAGRGVGPGSIVAVCMERCPEAVVAILAVLKAGAAYAVIDPAHPPARQAFLVDDTRAAVVLAGDDARHLRRPGGPDVIRLGADWPAVETEPADRFDGGATAGHPAYVVYTSGSTGRPKGVVVGHASLVNAYLGWEEAYDLRRPGASHLQMANMAFDVFTGDLMRALGSGGKLVLCPLDVLLEPERLHALMVREEVTHAEFAPAVLRGLMRYLADAGRSLGFMRMVIAGSDTWSVREYKELRRLCGPSTRAVNSYGLTEATIDSTFFEGEPAGLHDDAVVPIGRPFANTEVYILDEASQPVPVGVTGELHVGGSGLALGYLGRPGLTAERFVPNPFGGPGSRLYRTGDLARYRPDGNVEFLGRRDQQVKIRGMRVELGEVEAALGCHPSVRQAVVAVRDDAPGGAYLAAYVVLDGPGGPAAAELARFLGESVPSHMVPSAFVALPALPLTRNGKLDRAALPSPDPADRLGSAGHVAPRTPLEEELAAIWADVLRLDRVGIRDNFFHLGGHSLLATQVVSRVRDAFQVDLGLRQLFEAPTVAELSLLVLEAMTAPTTPWGGPLGPESEAGWEAAAAPGEPGRSAEGWGEP